MKNANPGCLSALLRMFGLTPKPAVSHQVLESDEEQVDAPYNLRDDFLSAAETSFYQVIKGMMGDYLTVCPKVSLSDVLYVSRKNERFQAYVNKIDRKHVDFLICESKTMKPRFAIELDDASHQREERVQRDEFVDRVFNAAGLPLVRVPVMNAYNVRELEMRFKAAVAEKPTPSVTQKVEPWTPTQSPPYCPSCGTQMVLREARRGANTGNKFYGCPNYPRCKTIIPVQ